MGAPQRVLDDSAAAEVLDVEAQVTVPVVRLKQRVVGVRPKELRRNTHSAVHCLIPQLLSTLISTV